MESGRQIDGGWASAPTGPQLSARLADVDLDALEDADVLAVLSAQSRQLAFQQAQTWAAMNEVAARDPMPWAVPRLSGEQVFDSAADEIRAELLLTRRGALHELERACTVCAQPRVFAALQSGELDRARALVLAEGCWDLTAEQAEKLLDKLLPEAATRSATGLAERVRRVAVALDPAWAERRYTQAVRQRRVIGYLNDDGTATVSGQYLPADAAAAACDRVDALADAAKRAGAKAPLDHLRTELFLALLDGRYQHLGADQIVVALCARFPTTDTDYAGDMGAEVTADTATAAAVVHTRRPGLGAAQGVELKVGLATLIGLDDQPGEIAGWGAITATVARAIAARQHGGQWRFAVLDKDGRLLSDGTTRYRPRAQRDPVQAEGGTVELHVPAALLEQAGPASAPPVWARLLTDLARQHHEQRPIEQDPTARHPGRPLRRRVQITSQRCIFPGCRRPASNCDQDHRLDHSLGGPTEEANLAPGCRHDHMNKTERGWQLHRLNEHTYCWISPLGRRHIVQIAPIAAPLPAPIPRLLPREITPRHLDNPEATFRARTRRGRPLTLAKEPTSAAAAGDEPPPF
jgi:hypothetical protein